MTGTATVKVEFYGGPADGMLLDIPAGATEYYVPSPAMTPAEFIALESGAPHPGNLPVLEHRYVTSHYFGRTSGKRLFLYRGPRRKR